MSIGRGRPGFLALMGAAWALSVGNVLGYALEQQVWPGPPIPMRVQLGPTPLGFHLQDGSPSWNATYENAIGLWNPQFANVQFTFTEADPATPVSNGDGINSVYFSDKVAPGESFSSDTLAVTLLLDNGRGLTTEADMVFNRAIHFDSYRGLLQQDPRGVGDLEDIHRIALHELGHVLGLDHPDQAHQTVTAIMNSRVSDLDHLAADDISGAQFLYGAPAAMTGSTRLANISTRVQVGTGDNVLIGGFIIQGSDPKKVIVRALGPSLAAAAVPAASVLADPSLELHDAIGGLVAANNNWRDTQAADITATGLVPGNDLESAVIATLNPGNYTAIVKGADGGSGIALVETYDLSSSGKIANISTRGAVGTGDNAMIGGFIVTGAGNKKVIVRALGPSLKSGANPVSNALGDPTLELRDANGQILQSNDDWGTSTDAQAIRDTTLAPSNPLESAVIASLSPGNYTAIVRGVNKSVGVALIEVYDLGN